MIVISLCFLSLQGQARALTIPKYIDFEGYSDQYFIELIKLAMEVSRPEYGDFRLQPYTNKIPPQRITNDASKGRIINIMWAPAINDIVNSELIQIPIPLMKGLAGIRILVIDRDLQSRFSSIENIEDLRDMNLGQDVGWADSAIYRLHGVPVHTAAGFEPLFNMLAAGRYDALPLGADQAADTLTIYRNTDSKLKLEESLAIQYQLPYNFFVSKNSPYLAERITFALEKMQESGQFDRFLNSYFSEKIDPLKLSERKVIYLSNHLIDPKFSNDDSTFWFKHDSGKKNMKLSD